MSAKILAALIIVVASVGTARADVLASVKTRGSVDCGVSVQTPGFATSGANGAWSGLGIDFCRSLAAAIFNDPAKVVFVPLQPDDRIAALTSGRADVLADPMPWTLESDTDHGLKYVATLFYDGQGFLAPKTANLKTARDLDGQSVCVDGSTPAQADVAEYFDANNISAKVVPSPTRADAVAAYSSGSCAAITADSTVLAGIRADLKVPTDHVLLPDIITKAPLAIVVSQGDDRWFDIARWTFYALLDAEELGVTQGNVDEMLGSDNISVRRLLGVESDFGSEIGLNKDWAYQLIKGVGDYADAYDRNLGEQTPMKLPRGLNALWNKGGIQYSPPVR